MHLLPASSPTFALATLVLAMVPFRLKSPFLLNVMGALSTSLSLSLSLSNSVFDEYMKTTGKPIEASIRGELSGDFEKLMLAVGMS